jgi:alkylation response protein AidB-like acyl-CoA dehydrogenase
MYTLTAASRAYVSTVAAAADAGHASRKDCAAVILHNAEAATRVALDAIQVGGARGGLGRLGGAGAALVGALLAGRRAPRHAASPHR